VTGGEVAIAAQLACLLEVSAPKPGNVSPGRHFTDARYEDFLASAAAIGQSLATVNERGIGATVRLAIEATGRWTRSNTNLGMVLLLAPLGRAAVSDEAGQVTASALRPAVRRVLAETTVNDAREVYAAIRRASPGGLGRAGEQDVAAEPSMTLLEVMRLAADRDGIAREYSTGFDVTFETGAPALHAARGDGLPWEEAVIETFLTLLAANPDTHVRRRGGVDVAVAISRHAQSALAAGGVRTPAGRQALDEMDRALRDPRHVGNPGTTADLTAAAIFVELAGGGWTDHPRSR